MKFQALLKKPTQKNYLKYSVNKSALRKKLINLRKKKYSNDIIITSDKFFNFLKRKKIKSKIFGCYYPFNCEMNILNILKSLEDKKFSLSLPKISKNNKMKFFEWSFDMPLKINKFGIPETVSKKRIFPKVLLVPLVGFDNKFNRLGYGGGYYDRYLSENNKDIIKIGVGFSFQKVKNLPVNKYDKKLDFIITEKTIY